VADSTDVTHATDTANCIHGGNTAQRVEAWNYNNEATRRFLSLLSGLCLEFVVRVPIVPTVTATTQLAIRTSEQILARYARIRMTRRGYNDL